MSPMVADVAERIVAREIKGLSARVEKSEQDRPKFNAWAYTWFEQHSEYVEKSIAPIANTCGLDKTERTNWIDTYRLESWGELGNGNVAEVLADWEQNKAASVAESIMEVLQCTTVS